jgi:16S rRNA (cytosine1402-N4)-methyltransferase
MALSQSPSHVPVLAAEVVAYLNPHAGGHYLDATVGSGGHAQQLLEAAPNGHLTALDRDESALAAARARLAPYGERVRFWHGNFAAFDPGEARFDGIVADLGASSAQLDAPERGFSFRAEAPLDMRMDRQQALTAADIVNGWSERALADLLYDCGEERRARRIARRIVRERPFATTTALAAAIARGAGRDNRIHPATRSFQALRIAVNDELRSLEAFLQRASGWLRPGARLAIVSFHSLEDRRVKHQLRADPSLAVETKKPLTPASAERDRNPRARSAKLRVARKREPTDGAA